MTPIVNRVIERIRGRSLRPLRDRFEHARERRPLVIVPSILGTRIVDGERVLWGSLPRLFAGPEIATARSARARGLLDGFSVVPGVFDYDVFGGLLRVLARTGGYRASRDLFVLEYDWRRSVADGAERLCELVAPIAQRLGSVDIVAISTGGIVVRHALRSLGANVRRTIYVGTPHRGSFQAISTLHDGLQMVALGRRFGTEELGACETCWDALPHPDDPVFVDDAGESLSCSLYDADVWRRFGLGPTRSSLAAQLERAHALHRALDAAPAHADSVVIGARHLPTLSKVIVTRGRATIAPCTPRRGDPLATRLFEPGDSSLSARSLAALPGLRPGALRFVTPREHHRLPADPQVHQLVLEALAEAMNA